VIVLLLSGKIKNYPIKFKNSIYLSISKIRFNNNIIKSIDPIRIDLGSGPSKRDGYIGIDLSPNADIQWDLRKGLPLDDNVISEIRSDHFFEHLELREIIVLLKECHRVLKPGGRLDFSVPHINPFIDAYLRKDYEFINEKITDIPKGDEELYSTCFDRIMWLLHRNGEHKSIFDKESIIDKVKLAGFSNVSIREFDPNKDINYRFSSVNVVAIK